MPGKELTMWSSFVDGNSALCATGLELHEGKPVLYTMWKASCNIGVQVVGKFVKNQTMPHNSDKNIQYIGHNSV